MNAPVPLKQYFLQLERVNIKRQKMTSFIAGHRIIRSVPGIEKVSSGLWEKILCFKHILGRNGMR